MTGPPLPPEWRRAFAAAPRAGFVPDEVWTEDLHPVSRTADPQRWQALVDSDVPIVTQVDDGTDRERPRRASSSCSMPGLVAGMLHHLGVADGMRVLEIGTGTGWNAALLGARLGDDRVISVEVDPAVAERARAALRRAGRAVRVVTGDGAAGWPSGAPYDRVIATCAVEAVPPAWITQTRPGGVILTPWTTAFHNGVLLRLEVQGDGTATGPVVEDDVVFMRMRGQRADRDVMDYVDASGDAPATSSRTSLDPRAVASATSPDAAFAVGLRVPCRHVVGWSSVGWSSVGWGSGAQAEECTVWIADPVTGSWASADYEPGVTTYQVEEYGPRSLWREVESAWHWWDRLGRPTRSRYGATADTGGRITVWLDSPSRTVARSVCPRTAA